MAKIQLTQAFRPAEKIDAEKLQQLVALSPIAWGQRLGYLLDKIFDNQMLANALYTSLQSSNASFFRTPLKASASTKGFSSDEKWKVIINTEIEPDE